MSCGGGAGSELSEEELLQAFNIYWQTVKPGTAVYFNTAADISKYILVADTAGIELDGGERFTLETMRQFLKDRR